MLSSISAFIMHTGWVCGDAGRRAEWGSAAALSAPRLQKGNSGPGCALPIRAGPKNHHFLWACESLIHSRQKAPMRKLFGKLKGSGRNGRPLQLRAALLLLSPLRAHPGPQRAAQGDGCSPDPGAVIPQAQKMCSAPPARPAACARAMLAAQQRWVHLCRFGDSHHPALLFPFDHHLSPGGS